MNNKRKLVPMESVLFLVVFFTTFQGSFGASKQTKSKASYGIGSSVVFPVTGNVYPKGYVLFDCGFLCLIRENAILIGIYVFVYAL